MIFNDQLRHDILQQIFTLPFWGEYKDRLSVALVGSGPAGLSDVHSDVDVYIFVPEEDSVPLYEGIKAGYQKGALDIMNPKAFDFDEYPMGHLAGIDGHYRPMVIESLEESVRSYVDIERWVCLNSAILHDPTGRFAALKADASEYPHRVLNRKLIRHYWFMRDNLWSIKKPLDRGQMDVISLLCYQGISHLLKFCILEEGKPFPYDKWLFEVAAKTRLGKLVWEFVERIMTELKSDKPANQEPEKYIRPDHRNAPYEKYRIYHLTNALRQVFEENMPTLEKDKKAMWDRLGAWKPR